MDELITEIEVEDETFDLIQRVAKVGEHPLELVRATELQPGEFAQFLQETGRSTDPAGLLLLGLSAGRSIGRPDGAEVRAVAMDLVSGGVFIGGVYAVVRSLQRKRWIWAAVSAIGVCAAIPLRLISRRFAPKAVQAAQARQETEQALVDLVTASSPGAAAPETVLSGLEPNMIVAHSEELPIPSAPAYSTSPVAYAGLVSG